MKLRNRLEQGEKMQDMNHAIFSQFKNTKNKKFPQICLKKANKKKTKLSKKKQKLSNSRGEKKKTKIHAIGDPSPRC